jgi:hypothetical protein
MLIVILLTAFMPVLSAFATAIGFFPPASARSNGPGWKNSTYTFTSDDLYATAVRGHKTLKLRNFNITAIQGGATIDGIEVTVEGRTLGLQADVSVYSATTGGFTAKKDVKQTALVGSDTIYTLGGPTDKWGQTWASSDFTNTNFAIKLVTSGTRGQTISIDQVRVKVYYTLGDSTLTLNPVSGDYGGTTTMTATLTATASGAPIASQPIVFSLNGTSVGSANTNSSGVAILSDVSLAGINAGDYPYGAGASFAGGGSFGPTSITADLYVHGTRTTLTVDPSTGTYTGVTGSGTTNFSATLTETVSGNPVANQTVNFYLGDTLAGSDTTDVNGDAYLTGTSGLLAGYDAGAYIDEVTAEFTGALIIEPSIGSAALIVNPIDLTVSGGLTPDNKMYDGNTSASLSIGSPSLNPGVISGDIVTLNTSGAIGTFSDKHVGANKTVQISGLTLGGIDADNYLLTQPTRQADITTKPITVAAVTNTKVYDGTTSASATPSNSGLAFGDTANFTESYTTKHVGIGNKTLVPAGVVNDGNSGNNYSYTYANFTEGSITTLSITVTAVMNTKEYDGTTSAAATPINSGLATGDTASFVEIYSDKNIGVGNKTLIPSGVVSDGNSGNNYSYTYTNFTTGTINKASATIIVNGYTGTYDGAAHGATLISATGVNSEDLSASVSLGSSFTNGPGGMAHWTFTNANYNDQSGDVTIVINPADQTISFSALADKTLGDADFPVSATASSGLSVNFSSITTGVCAVSSGTVHLISGGECTIRASQAGNGNYNAAPNVDRSFIVNAAAQTITFGALADKTFGAADFAVSATASSGLAVSFSSTTADVCTVSNGIVHIVSAGECTIRASQTGNGNYNAAPNVDRSFTVNPANQAISFGALADKTFGNADFTVSATASSGLDVSFSSTTAGVCTVSSGTVHIVSAGECTIRASQTGNGNYNAAPNVDRSFTVNPANQTISFSTLTDKILGDADFSVSATATSGLDVSFSSTTADVCTVSSGTVHLISEGSCTIRASQAGNGNYSAAPDVNRSFTVHPAGSILVTISDADTNLTVNNKVYDGNTTATLNISGATLVGITGGDDVTLVTSNATAAFSDKNVGTGKTVTISGLNLSGADAYKYSLVQPTRQANITAKGVTASGVTANNKEYDGTTADNGFTGGTLSGVIGSDNVNLDSSGASGTFASKNVGSWAVSASGFDLMGADAGNYSLSAQPAVPNANITAKGVTITGVFVINKVYDGTTTATLNLAGAGVSGVVAPDDVVVNSGSASATFASANVGNWAITASGFAIGGTNAGNYALSAQPIIPNANITKASQTISFDTLADKFIGAPDFSISATSTSGLSVDFATTTASVCTVTTSGTVHLVSIGVCAITAHQGGNGNYNAAPNVSQNFTVKESIVITIASATLAANNKVYDGNAAATLNTSGTTLVGIASGDIAYLVWSGVTAAFSDENVGTGKAVTVSGLTLGGADAYKYSLTQPTGLTADITKATISVTADNQSMASGAADPAFTFTYGAFVGSDTADEIDTDPSCTAATPHTAAGTYPITCSGGVDNNYDFTYTDGVLTVSSTSVTVNLSSAKKHDGWVLESSETSNKGGARNSKSSTIMLGDDANNKQYRAILSFNTALPAGAVIDSVQLKIRLSKIVGTSPFKTHKGLVVDVKNATFKKIGLELIDFSIKASKAKSAKFSKTPLPGKWYVATFDSAMFGYFNTTGITQLRLRFNLDDNNDHAADYITFYSGSSVKYGPALVITYHVP